MHLNKANELYENGVLAVSIGNKDFESNQLDELLQKSAKKVKKIYIEIGCTLQRYNIILFNPKISNDEATRIARNNGDSWWNRNKSKVKKYLGDKLCLECQVPSRWDKWLTHPDYERLENEFQQLCRKNDTLKYAMNYSIDAIKQRFLKNKSQELNRSKQQYQDYYNVSQKDIDWKFDSFVNDTIYRYLAEESVIVMQLWQVKDYNVILYPNKITAILQASFDIFVSGKRNGCLRWLPIRIKRHRNT